MLAALDTNSGAFLVVAVLGTVAFATSGVIAAAETDMDWLGAVVLAVVVAIGMAVVGVEVLRLRHGVDPRRHAWYVASDAVGLGAFVAVRYDLHLPRVASNRRG